MSTLQENKPNPASDESAPKGPSLQALVASVLIEATQKLGQWTQDRESIDALIGQFETYAASSAPQSPERLESISQSFDLNTFESKALILCLARELVPESAALFSIYHRNPILTQPTFRACHDLLEEPDLAANAPNSPLRLWSLIVVDNSATLNDSPLQIDENIFHYAMGRDGLDPRLQPYFKAMETTPDTHQRALVHTEQILKAWQDAANFFRFPVAILKGVDQSPRIEIVSTLCQKSGIKAFTLRPNPLPDNAVERNDLKRLWEREALLKAALLYIEAPKSQESVSVKDVQFDWACQLDGPVVIGSRQGLRNPLPRHSILIELEEPNSISRFETVKRVLEDFGIEADEAIRSITDHFRLSESALQQATLLAIQQQESAKSDLFLELWDACKRASRGNLGILAQRLKTPRDWASMVLPEKQFDMLQQVCRQVKHRVKVHNHWGFAEQNPHGLGITALFSGPSGTGKTLAAEILANDLNLDLYRLDLSAVVSKYIGETEENLRQVFDAAEAGGSILLIDEADSIYGSRSEVKDSHDRHANIEVSYLLQKMETYRGLAILTTNFKQALDKAFLRRIRFIVDFPFPDIGLRQRLWQSAFPCDAPVYDLQFDKLAKLSLAGGNIRNIALNAAFLAADNGDQINMRHIQTAVRQELSKLDTPINETEIRALAS